MDNSEDKARFVWDPAAVMEAEREDIAARRKWLHEHDDRGGAGAKPDRSLDGKNLGDLVGVSLSGGGIRSAAFCLGALQALDAVPAPDPNNRSLTRSADSRGKGTAFERVDYLSTVSGGGFIGAATTVGMSHFNGVFPFRSSLETDEPLALQHVRDHSNYLFPKREWALVRNLGVVLRGLVANIALVTPVLLGLAFLTLYLYRPESTGPHVTNSPFFHLVSAYPQMGIPSIPLWIIGVAAFVLLLFPLGFALWRPFGAARGNLTINQGSNKQLTLFKLLAGGLIVLFAIEVQPFYPTPWWLIPNTPLRLTAVVAVGVFVGLLLAAFIWSIGPARSETTIVHGRDQVQWPIKIPAIVLILVFAIEVQPLLLDRLAGLMRWLTDGSAEKAIQWLIGIAGAGSGAVAVLRGKILALAGRLSAAPGRSAKAGRLMLRVLMIAGGLAGPLLLWLVFALVCFRLYDRDFAPPLWSLIAVAVGGLMLVSVLDANANSLHRLYRDRLSWAFLVSPRKRANDHVKDEEPLTFLNTERLTDLNPALAPYHLFNATLNLRGSRHANRRGRDGDFFLFSRRFVGSRSTGYVRLIKKGGEVVKKGVAAKMVRAIGHTAKRMAGSVPWEEPDVGTVIAICGAAVSSNMGSLGLNALAPTLAIANVRLGYWLANPKSTETKPKWWERLLQGRRLYFLNEVFGLLNETSPEVYLTDGGHIENLGVYELLRRQCRLIIVVDGECDPNLGFAALIKLERYARIDLGIRIEIPWEAIGAARPAGEERPPHCAVGQIFYPNGVIGTLLYVKASVNGDENDYVADYKRRNPAFPHESTLDQFFTEEQFEVYRALGFHALQRALVGEDSLAIKGGHAYLNAPGAADIGIETIRALLMPPASR